MNNDTMTSRTLDCVLQNALKYPDNIAVQGISYAKLAQKICGLSRQIEGDRILIACEQGLDAYVAMLAALHSGATYAPVNLNAPKDRLQIVEREFNPTDVICDPKNREKWPKSLVIGTEEDIFNQTATINPAYVIFTSGSTGKPKGVVISRKAMDHFVDWSISALSLGPASRVSQHPNIAFDLSVMDIFSSLAAGSELLPLTNKMDKIFPARSIGRDRLTHWISVPSVIDLMSRDTNLARKDMETVERFIFCGEPLLERHLEFIFKIAPHAVVLNTYGPTEATVCMTSQKIEISNWKQFLSNGAATLGQAIPGMSINLLGGKADSEGEIIISGPQVADGYWNSPKLTEKSFHSGAYHTGDWAEIKDDRLFFRSRIDRQVKIQGYRIELGDIEASIYSQTGFVTACLSVDKEIIAILEGNEVNPYKIMSLISKDLPSYMLPHKLEFIGNLPRSLNDKIDYQAIKSWYKSRVITD